MDTLTPKQNEEKTPLTGKKAELFRVEERIGDLCDSLKPGDRVPAHRELMRVFSASERTVLKALDEMQRKGRIIRRSGSGTYVSDRPRRTPFSRQAGEGSIVAISIHDDGFFDWVSNQLIGQIELAGMKSTQIFTTFDRGMRANTTHVKNPQGFVVFGHVLADVAQRLFDAGHRVVLVGEPPVDRVSYPIVYSDAEHAGYVAAKHLIDLGHSRLLYFHDDSAAGSSPRLPGIERAVNEARLSGKLAEIKRIHPDLYNPWLTDPATVSQYFQSNGAPTAIIAWNDSEGLAVVEALQRASISVPQDVSVIGHDNMPQGGSSSPPLTTIDSSISVLIKYVLDLVLRPEPPAPGSKTVIVPTLIARQSTSSPARI
jgi:DNA-binding LacI/PurR family transcriptional regulator/DNA-binding transcriptional regulator YhcF (GntR family)